MRCQEVRDAQASIADPLEDRHDPGPTARVLADHRRRVQLDFKSRLSSRPQSEHGGTLGNRDEDRAGAFPCRDPKEELVERQPMPPSLGVPEKGLL